MKTASGGEKSDRVTRPSFFVTFSKLASRAAREAQSDKSNTSYQKMQRRTSCPLYTHFLEKRFLFEPFFQKTGDSWISYQAISAFDQAVALVLEAQVFDGNLALAQSGDNLLSLSYRHARIVGSVDDEEWRGNPVHVADRRDLLQKFAVVLQAAIFALAQFAPPGMGVLQEGHEIGDTHDVDGGRPQTGIGSDSREHHEAAIAAAHHDDTLRISDAARAQPERCVLQIVHGIHTFAHVIQAHIRVAIAAAATHVGSQHCIPLGHKVLIDRIEDGPCLALRPTVDVDYHRQAARGLITRQEEKRRDLTLVKRRIVDQRRLDKAFARDAAQRAARGLPELCLLDIPDEDIHRSAG